MSKWPMVKLGDLFTLQMGKTPSRSNSQYWNNGTLNWSSIFDINDNQKYLYSTRERITELAAIETGIQRIPANTVIMSFKLSIGKTAITHDELYTNEAIMAFLPKKEVCIDVTFLYYVLKNKDWSHGSNRAVLGLTLNKATLFEHTIPLPPLEEQKRIVCLLDRAQALIDKRKEQLAHMDNLTQSLFYEMFGDPVKNEKGWEVQRIDSFCDCTLGKMLDQKKQTGQNKRIYLRNANVQWFSFNLEELLLMDFDMKAREKFSLQENDILMCEGGVPGRCAIWKNELDECYFQKAIHRIRIIKQNATPEYLVWFFWFFSMQDGLKDYISTSTIAHLPAEKLGLIPVTLPPLLLQKRFSEKQSLIARQKDVLQKGLNDLSSLFSSLMSEAFD